MPVFSATDPTASPDEIPGCTVAKPKTFRVKGGSLTDKPEIHPQALLSLCQTTHPSREAMMRTKRAGRKTNSSPTAAQDTASRSPTTMEQGTHE